MYVDYDYYKNIYKGAEVSENEFGKFELQARLTIDNYTLKSHLIQKYLKDGKFVDNIKMAMCELIDNGKEASELMAQAQKGQKLQLSGLSSESVKDHSISINTSGDAVLQVKNYINKKDIEVMYKYLLITNLLNRGF